MCALHLTEEVTLPFCGTGQVFCGVLLALIFVHSDLSTIVHVAPQSTNVLIGFLLEFQISLAPFFSGLTQGLHID